MTRKTCVCWALIVFVVSLHSDQLIAQTIDDRDATEQSHREDQNAISDSTGEAVLLNQWQKGFPIWVEFAKYLIPIIGVITAAWMGYRKWQFQNFSDKWYGIMEFLHEHPGFMDAKKNMNYRENYSDPKKLWEYESIARMCISYVDDAYFLGFSKQLDDWLVGVIPLFIGRHYSWFRDNPQYYDPKFVNYVEEKLNRFSIPLTSETEGANDE